MSRIEQAQETVGEGGAALNTEILRVLTRIVERRLQRLVERDSAARTGAPGACTVALDDANV